MKYLIKPWNQKPLKHHIRMENKTPTRTVRHRGYGLGLTFSSRCYAWSKNFSSGVQQLIYSEFSIAA